MPNKEGTLQTLWEMQTSLPRNIQNCYLTTRNDNQVNVKSTYVSITSPVLSLHCLTFSKLTMALLVLNSLLLKTSQANKSE